MNMRYSYQEIVDTIQNARRFGSMTGMEVSKNMLEQLGNPQSGIPFVHIAGTNGKGSTTAFLCKILQQSGRKVGMFTSPHLITFEERIRINDELISKEDVKRLGNLLLETQFEVSPTMFDYCLVMAVLYFKEKNCDVMVMETGIGGRYDSTNALGVPLVSVITKIGMDHTAILGDTLEKIAAEKAGIIKCSTPVILSRQEESARKVLYDTFRNVNHLPDNAETGTGKKPDLYEVMEDDLSEAEQIPMRMQGGYQIENAATAMLAAKVLFKKWGETSHVRDYIEQGIADTFWKGRMEIVNQNPFFMIDGAHNAHGVRALADSLLKLYPGEKFHFIMGVMADKDYEDMIDVLLPIAIDFVTVTPESNRALQSEKLAECVMRKGVRARFAEDMETEIRPLLPLAQEGSKSGEKTIAFGSLYFIGAIEAML